MVVIAIFSLYSCDKYPGFEKTESGIYRRLDKFGDCPTTLSEADFFLMNVDFKKVVGSDTGYHFQLHHHAIRIKSQDGDPIGLRLGAQLDSMNCGDKITLILPFSEFDNTYLGAFADTSMYKLDDEIELTLDLLKTFSKKEYLNYLMSLAQHGETTEPEVIELYLMNSPSEPSEKHGDCFIQFIRKQNGDSIKAGRDVSLRWNTFLFNGTRLDDTTDMQFVFGKPGQLVGGFQYGLSFLGEGDKARIYLPSYRAFGENGSSSGIIPPRTPVYFEVEVMLVVTEDEVVTLKTKSIKNGKNK